VRFIVAKNKVQESEPVAAPYIEPHTKAVVDGVWNCEGRMVLAESEEQAILLYSRVFNGPPAFCDPSERIPDRDEKVLHLRSVEGHPEPIPFFGRRSL
jgi:hypothetical protein